MIELRTNSITIRGVTYVVRELSAKEMAAARKFVTTDEHRFRFETFVAFTATVSPKFANEAEADEAPQYVIDKLSSEAMRLSKEDVTPGKT